MFSIGLFLANGRPVGHRLIAVLADRLEPQVALGATRDIRAGSLVEVGASGGSIFAIVKGQGVTAILCHGVVWLAMTITGICGAGRLISAPQRAG